MRSIVHWLIDHFTYLICRFRTWQLHRYPDSFPSGTAVWCDLVLLAKAPSRLIPGVLDGQSSYLDGERVVSVRVFREGPLGTKVDTIAVSLTRISWRNK